MQETYAAPSVPDYLVKKEPIEQVRQIPEYYETEGDPAPFTQTEADWQPGFISRFPWLGLGALLLVLLCLGGNVAVLTISHGMSQGDQTWKQIYHHGLTKGRWPKQIRPSVILTVLNSVANLAFSLAIANGVAIAWWRKALKGSTIKSLHKSWNFSSSVKAAALSALTLKGFNAIALAALIAKCTIIDGILMQSATVTAIAPDPPSLAHTINSWANATIPTTAHKSIGSGNQQTASFVTDDVFMWKQSPLVLPYAGFTGCENATCFTEVAAAGFEFDCTVPTRTSTNWTRDIRWVYGNVTDPTSPDGSRQTVIEKPGTSIFKISFNMQYSDFLDSNDASKGYTPGALTLDVQYAQANDVGNTSILEGPGSYAGCPGTMYSQSCTLRPAVISYPVMAQAYGGARNTRNILLTTEEANAQSRSLAFDRDAKQQQGFKVVQTVDVYENNNGLGDSSQLAGLLQTFNTLFAGQVNLTSYYKLGYELATSGNAQEYISTVPADQYGYCGFSMNSPISPDTNGRKMQSLVAMINEIMFMIATDASGTNPEAKHEYNAYTSTMYTESIHYRTRFLYMMGAIISTVVCVACVLPTYWGYWQLGRKVSLGPFEIAHAFRSPMTARAGGGGDIEQVMQTVGHQPVQYGNIVSGDARGVMGVAEPEYVAGLQSSAKQELREKFMRRGRTE